MRKLLLMVLPLVLLALSSCDQDASYEDSWEGVEMVSHSAKAKSVSNESEPTKLLYILPGSGTETFSYGADQELELMVNYSWEGGFAHEHIEVKVDHSIHSKKQDWKVLNFCGLGGSVSNARMTIEIHGTLFNTKDSIKQDFQEEVSAPVQSELRSPVNMLNK